MTTLFSIAFRDMNIETCEQPDVDSLRREIRACLDHFEYLFSAFSGLFTFSPLLQAVAQEMERSYGLLGSIFRSGKTFALFR